MVKLVLPDASLNFIWVRKKTVDFFEMKLNDGIQSKISSTKLIIYFRNFERISVNGLANF